MSLAISASKLAIWALVSISTETYNGGVTTVMFDNITKGSCEFMKYQLVNDSHFEDDAAYLCIQKIPLPVNKTPSDNEDK